VCDVFQYYFKKLRTMLYTCLNSSSHLAHRPAIGTYHRLSLLRRKIELQLRFHAPLNCVACPATFADNRTHQLQHGHPRVPNLLACTASKGRTPQPVEIDNYELLVGDCVALVCFALYKQIAAIVLSPTFPGETRQLQRFWHSQSQRMDDQIEKNKKK